MPLANSDEMSEQEPNCDVDNLRYLDLKDDILKMIGVGEVNDNDNPTKNIWTRI